MQGYLFDCDDFGAALVSGDAPPGEPALTLADGRPYQYGWRDGTLAAWGRAARALGVAATGTGKSFGAALVIRAVLDGALAPLGREPRCLFIAHRSLLVNQAAAGLTALLPDKVVEVEMGEAKARGAADVVVASLDSLCIPRRLAFFREHRYAAAVWDEAHRYGLGNSKVKRVMDHFGADMRHLGITATPDRTDGQMAFRELAFEYDIWKAVDDGYLVRPGLAYEIAGDLKLEGVKRTKDGEFDADDLADLMSSAGPIAAVVKAARKWSNFSNGHPARRPTVITCASVEHAKLVAVALNEWHAKDGGGAAGVVHSGQTPADQGAVLDGFRSGALQYVTHFDVLTEGFDSDRPKVLINGRPCKARWVFAQGAGRTLRPANSVRRALAAEPTAAGRRAIIAGSEKPGALIVDVAGTTHGLSVDLLTVFRDPLDDDEVVERARQRARDRSLDGIPSDPAADLKAVREALAIERTARREEKDRANAHRWKGVLVDTDFTATRMADPFAPGAVAGREPPWARKKRPTLPMKQALLRAGVPREAVEGYSFWAAKTMLDVVADRRKKGLCSYKQLKTLTRFGVDANGMSFEEAGATLDAIAKSGWKYAPASERHPEGGAR